MILIGTSGYSYPEWRGVLYPNDARPDDFLAWYSRRFRACEINFTYYRPPDVRTIERILARSEGRVTFTVKLTGEMTHERTADAEAFRRFSAAIAPLRNAGVLGALLAQFPWSFRPSAEADDYLARLRDRLPEDPVVVEFRNAAWVRQATFERLREVGLGFCSVDEPRLPGLLPPVAVVTSAIAYARFHGRNAAKWWKHEHPAERYDYLYSTEEIAEWVPRIRKMAARAKKTFVFTNNHFAGHAVRNAVMLKELLERESGEE